MIAGAVLRAARRSTNLTQEDFAAASGVSVDAVKRWENGQRPLGRMKAADLMRLQRRLRQLGARQALLGQIHAAIEADEFTARAVAGDCGFLGSEVTTRPWSSLIAWAVTGAPPAEARDVAQVRPLLPAATRKALFASVREAADRSAVGAGHLLHQAYYLAALDTSDGGAAWLADAGRAEARRIRLTGKWNPDWAVARSLAIAAACQGDPGPLRWFIRDHPSDPACDEANLAYWAYWIGSDGELASGEEFMVSRPLDIRRGTALMQHLVGNLTPALPYAELSVRSLGSLLRRWPGMLAADPALAASLGGRTSRMLDTDARTPGVRRDLTDLYRAATAAHATAKETPDDPFC
jgi:transcriptional regulator with XRE-family HTH domain